MAESIKLTLDEWATRFDSMAIVGGQAWEESATITAEEIKNRAIEKTPRRSGKARRGWKVRGQEGSREIFNDAEHWPFIREGTGAFGPSGGRIEPNEGKVLVFTKEGETHWKRWSRGMAPRDPMGEVDISSALGKGVQHTWDRLDEALAGHA